MERNLASPRWVPLGFVLVVICAPVASVTWAATAVQAAASSSQHPGSVAPVSTPVVSVSGAWIRATVGGQTGTGGYLSLTSRKMVNLVGFSTPVASLAELHEMKMEGDVMRMQSIESLPLPAGQTVSLQPGGHHLMLMGLKHTLKPGDQVPLTLLLRTPQGQTLRQEVSVPVRAH